MDAITPSARRSAALKLGAFGFAVLSVQVTQAILRPDWYPELAIMGEALRAGSSVVYFGDSVVRYTRDTPGADDLAELLSSQAATPIARFDGLSYHPGVFAAAFQHVAALASPPELVIVPINLRSFAPLWSRKPAYQFEIEQWALVSGAARTAATLFPVLRKSQLSTLTVADYLALRLEGPAPLLPRIGSYMQSDGFRPRPEVTRAEFLMVDYGIPIRPDHERLESLREIARRSRNGPRVVFYLTPVDIATMETELGASGVAQARASGAMIARELRAEGAVVLNFLDTLAPEHFHYPLRVNEHLARSGRERLVNRLAEDLARLAERATDRHTGQ